MQIIKEKANIVGIPHEENIGMHVLIFEGYSSEEEGKETNRPVTSYFLEDGNGLVIDEITVPGMKGREDIARQLMVKNNITEDLPIIIK